MDLAVAAVLVVVMVSAIVAIMVVLESWPLIRLAHIETPISMCTIVGDQGKEQDYDNPEFYEYLHSSETQEASM